MQDIYGRAIIAAVRQAHAEVRLRLGGANLLTGGDGVVNGAGKRRLGEPVPALHREDEAHLPLHIGKRRQVIDIPGELEGTAQETLCLLIPAQMAVDQGRREQQE